MHYEADTHTHTLASGHAYNTIMEMVQAAAAKGLKALAITDHTKGGKYYTFHMEELPRILRSILPLSAKREDNFIGGLSGGSAMALKSAILYPENFSVALCMSGGGLPIPGQIPFKSTDDPAKRRKVGFPGPEIPADAELLESTSLSINESSLTGEPLCRKNADPAGAIQDATYPSNRVYRGTKVMEGHGICRVFAVGDSTEYGKVYKQAQIDNQVKTPLNEQLDRLGGTISTISYVLAVLILVGRAFVFLHGLDGAPIVWIEFLSYMLQSIMIAVTLIVVAVPEGLV